MAEAVPDLRDDVIYLDGELVRMEAEPWCGQVVLHFDSPGAWVRSGWVVAADTQDATVHVIPELDRWLANGRNRERLVTAARRYYESARS